MKNNPTMAGARHVLKQLRQLRQLDRSAAFRLPADHLKNLTSCRKHELSRSRVLRKSVADFIKKHQANVDPETGSKS